MVLDASLDCLDRTARVAVAARLEAWFAQQLVGHVPVLVALDAATRDPALTAPLRAVAGALLAEGGIAPRRPMARMLDALDHPARKQLRAMGVTIGTLDLFDTRLLKPAAARWRRALLAARDALAAGLPPEGATVLPRDHPGARLDQGFRPLGAQAVRVDLVERIARAAHDARAGRKPFAPDPALATSIGMTAETLARLMAQLGFRTARRTADAAPRWIWHGLTRTAAVKPAPRDNAFAALAALGSARG